MDIYQKMGLKEEQKVELKIEKSKILEDKVINDEYKTIFEKYVNYVMLKYCLKQKEISSYSYDGRERYEIEIIEIEINNKLAVFDVATIIGRRIPYPTIIIFKHNNKFRICSYEVRENKNVSYKNVVENCECTGWFDDKILFGRIIRILECIKNTFNNEMELFSKYKKVYEIIYKNRAKYEKLNDIEPILKKIGINESKKSLLNNFNFIPIEEEKYTKIDIYKVGKLKKYSLGKNSEVIKINTDELYKYIYDNTKYKYRTYESFISFIETEKRNISIQKNIIYRLKEECKYYDFGECTLFGHCSGIKKCTSFSAVTKEKSKKYDIDINKTLSSNIYKIKLQKISDIEKNDKIVQEGDTVEILNIKDNNIKKYAVVQLIDGEIPPIPSKCLGQEVGFEFSYKHNNYKIQNIIKDIKEGLKTNERKECSEIIEPEIIVEKGDSFEYINLKSRKICTIDTDKEYEEEILEKIKKWAIGKKVNARLNHNYNNNYEIIEIIKKKR